MMFAHVCGTSVIDISFVLVDFGLCGIHNRPLYAMMYSVGTRQCKEFWQWPLELEDSIHSKGYLKT